MKLSNTVITLVVVTILLLNSSPGLAISADGIVLLNQLRAKLAAASAVIVQPALVEADPGSDQPEELPLEKLVRQARDGVPEAQAELGVRVLRGHGVVRNLKEAEIWLNRASLQGFSFGQLQLARLLHTKKRNRNVGIEAYAWASIAALDESADAQTRAEAIALRDLMAQKMAPKAILKGRQLAANMARLIKPENQTSVVGGLQPKIATGYVVGLELQQALARLRIPRSRPATGMEASVTETPAMETPVTEASSQQFYDADAAFSEFEELPDRELKQRGSPQLSLRHQTAQEPIVIAPVTVVTPVTATAGTGDPAEDSDAQEVNSVAHAAVDRDHGVDGRKGDDRQGDNQNDLSLREKRQVTVDVAAKNKTVDRTPDLESALQKYREHMAARSGSRKDPSVVATPAPDTEESLRMEDALQRLQDFRLQREEWERKHGIPEVTPTADEVERRVLREQNDMSLSDEEMNVRLQAYAINQPHDYSIDVY